GRSRSVAEPVPGSAPTRPAALRRGSDARRPALPRRDLWGVAEVRGLAGVLAPPQLSPPPLAVSPERPRRGTTPEVGHLVPSVPSHHARPPVDKLLAPGRAMPASAPDPAAAGNDAVVAAEAEGV